MGKREALTAWRRTEQERRRRTEERRGIAKKDKDERDGTGMLKIKEDKKTSMEEIWARVRQEGGDRTGTEARWGDGRDRE